MATLAEIYALIGADARAARDANTELRQATDDLTAAVRPNTFGWITVAEIPAGTQRHDSGVDARRWCCDWNPSVSDPEHEDD